MKRFTPLLLLVVALSNAAMSKASSVTITDNLASNGHHSPIGHWQKFSTTLTASADTPEPQAETTITGPIFLWSGDSVAVHRTSSEGKTIELESTPGKELPAGRNIIKIQCTATFTRTKNGETLSPIELKGDIAVDFWSRVPKSVKSLDKNPVKGRQEKPITTGGSYYHSAFYNFVVLDNQKPAQPYELGSLREKFDSYKPADDYADSLKAASAPGDEAIGSSPSAYFEDHNFWSTDGWTPEDVAETATKGSSDFWYSFGQTFITLDQTLPGGNFYKETPLEPHFIVTHRRDSVERH